MKAVGYKGHLGCIEILKAKAAIMSDRFCMNKAQRGGEPQRKRGGTRQQSRISYSILLPVYTMKVSETNKLKSCYTKNLIY